jgi:anti-sigma factor RsiW
MPGPLDRTDDAALWRRLRSAAAMGPAPAEPNALVLAAYAEGRLSEAEAEALEEWLAQNPAVTTDVLFARRAERTPLPAASPAIIARASALVGTSAEVLRFPRPTPSRRGWRSAASWGAMAASLVMAIVLGYTVGHDAGVYAELARGSSTALGQELIDPPTGLFNGLDEDSST